MKRALCLSCPPLYHPQFQALKEFVHAGELGQIRSISATFSFPHTDPSNTKYAPSKGGGALLDVGFYPLVVPASLFEEEPDLLGANTVIEDGYAVDTFGAALLHYPETGIHHTATWGYGGDYINAGKTRPKRCLSPRRTNMRLCYGPSQMRRYHRIHKSAFAHRHCDINVC